MKSGTEVMGKCLFIVPEIVVFASSIKHKGWLTAEIYIALVCKTQGLL